MRDESRTSKIAVVVGTITNDVRLFDVPKLTVILWFENILFGWFFIIS